MAGHEVQTLVFPPRGETGDTEMLLEAPLIALVGRSTDEQRRNDHTAYEQTLEAIHDRGAQMT